MHCVVKNISSNVYYEALHGGVFKKDILFGYW